MKIKALFILCLTWACPFFTTAQNLPAGIQVQIDIEILKTATIASTNRGESIFSLMLPLPDGTMVPYQIHRNQLMEAQPTDIVTLGGQTSDGSTLIQISITPSGLTGILRSNNAYFIIEPIDKKSDTYIIYNINDSGRGECFSDSPEPQKFTNESGKILSTGAFPVGSQMRTYRFAGAATGEMTTAYGNQTAARDRIVSILNATNLIYQVEASVQFSLVTKTTNHSLIFTNPNTDPFTVNPNFGSAGDSQTGFNTLNGSNALLYNEYDMGHTFNNIISNGARGTGGGSPCIDNSKSSGWTEFGTSSSLGIIVGVFAHEVGHQFNAWHTYNAIGGAGTSPTFCTDGWDSQTAVEPGSGSTLMAYGNNCSNDTNGSLPSYVLSSPNNESYFHVKSLDQIFTKMAGVSNCFSSTATGNTPPVATVGSNATIPKGTPFSLTGSATDANELANLSYAWEQMDIASSNDKGALGSAINGAGGYPAVNSNASAPLFRSKISSSPTRIFPDMNFILNNSNNPADNEGEDLPQVARTMNFRFTVRDNQLNGGGLDSEHLVVTVNSAGPFMITSHNTTSSIAAGSSINVTWAVNGTNALSANVKITMAIDGYEYPFVLLAFTPNDGSETVTIPANFPASTKARIKVSSIGGNGFEWFDVNDANLTLTSACAAVSNVICPANPLTTDAGNGALNLGLGYAPGTYSSNKTFNFSFASVVTRTLVGKTSGGACVAQLTDPSIIVPFQVSTTGTYAIVQPGATHLTTILSNSSIDCSGFVGTNFTNDGGSFNWSNSTGNVNLQACTTYYLIIYVQGGASNGSFTFSGTGDIFLLQTAPAGFSYTYVAFNKSTGNADAISASSNFTNLPGGNYNIKGLLYQNGFNPATYIGNSESSFYQSGSCLLFSSNSKPVTVIGAPCPSSILLTSTANDISSGTQVYQSSNTAAPGLIQATNKITGGTVTYDAGKKVELNPGFKAENAVFKAQIGGCN